jgi:hypothetical protein
LAGDDGKMRMKVSGAISAGLPESSVFKSVAEASAFFERGSLGFSPGRKPGTHDGLELHCENWRVEPLAVEQVESSYFSDQRIFPAGSVTYDCALLMRNIRHEWHSSDRTSHASRS